MIRQFIFFIIFLIPIRSVFSFYDPISVPNNKYGMHLADTNDIFEASKLVNSSGGQWGYLTVVMPDTDMNTDKWQGIFDDMRRNKVIPIIRIATHVSGNAWIAPERTRFDDWVSFLASLNWPVENRYVILFNEPNHANEWGGKIDPEGYSDLYIEFAKKLRASSGDYFLMPAAMDVSADNSSGTMDAQIYLQRMIVNNPSIFDLMDGIASHSYPNPGFSGSPYAIGRGTLRSYEWEINVWKQFGVLKQLPVFITETGWVHNNGKQYNSSYLSPQQVAMNIEIAAKNIWTDNRIVAVTPFVFNYQDEPFDHFSWRKIGDLAFYDFYDTYKNIQKIKGQPQQKLSYLLETPLFPDILINNSTYYLSTRLRNTGQDIITRVDGYELTITDSKEWFSFTPEQLPVIEPRQSESISVKATTKDNTGETIISAAMKRNDRIIALESHTVRLINPPILEIDIPLIINRNKVSECQIELFSSVTNRGDIYKDCKIRDGVIRLERLNNIIPNSNYYISVTIPGYGARTVSTVISEHETILHFPAMYPFDLNNDQKISISDIGALIRYTPFTVITKLF